MVIPILAIPVGAHPRHSRARATPLYLRPAPVPVDICQRAYRDAGMLVLKRYRPGPFGRDVCTGPLYALLTPFLFPQ